ncbi:MAG TPA: hypothetical protein VGF75_02270 [Candidatus Saccharimonadales bacterium]
MIISILALLLGFIAFSPTVLASVDIAPSCTAGYALGSTDVCKSVESQTTSGKSPILKTLKTAIDLISLITGVASVIMLIVAGFQFIAGGSNPQTVATARNTLLYAIAGVAVTVLAQVIVVFVIDNVLK